MNPWNVHSCAIPPISLKVSLLKKRGLIAEEEELSENIRKSAARVYHRQLIN